MGMSIEFSYTKNKKRYIVDTPDSPTDVSRDIWNKHNGSSIACLTVYISWLESEKKFSSHIIKLRNLLKQANNGDIVLHVGFG